MKEILISILLVASIGNSYAQFIPGNIPESTNSQKLKLFNSNKMTGVINIGVSINLGTKRNNSISGFASLSILQNLTKGKKASIVLGAKSHLEISRGGIGSSLLNGDKFKFNIEIKNSLMIIAGTFDTLVKPYGKPAFVNIKHISDVQFDPFETSFSLGTMFINGINHKRNQQIGTGSVSYKNFIAQYYNDGTPYGAIGLGDGYDRYWTGGGMIGYYFSAKNSTITDFVVRYDNYTGYQTNLYEISNLLQIDYLPYKNYKEQLFNMARFKYSIGIQNTIRLGISVYEPIYTDIQNLIHYNISSNSFHARSMYKRYTFNFDYLNFKQF